MSRIGVAFRAFFGALSNGETADRIAAALVRPVLPESNRAGETSQPSPAVAKTPPPPKRSDAVSLLAALQREARFVDLVQEPLDSYSDEQIGGAARNVLRDCRATLARFFSLKPVIEKQEGDPVELPASYDPARYQVTGPSAGGAARAGKLVHPGWEAEQCNLPAWTGGKESALVVAAAVVEVS